MAGSLVATVDDGDARGRGTVHVHDGTSKTILIADGSVDAACVDTDGDGTAGLARMSIGLHDIQSGARLTAEVTPSNGDIDDRGRMKVKFPDLGADSGPLEVDAWITAKKAGGEHRR